MLHYKMNLKTSLNQLLSKSTYVSLLPAYKVLLFYCVVLLVTSTVGHTLDKKNGFTYGLVVGMVVSLYLWVNYGKKMSYL